MDRAIGGFFPLELRADAALPFPQTLPVNLGRTGLELILRHRQYRRVRVPVYCCPVVFRTLRRCGVEWECYRIDENLEPIGGTTPDGTPMRDPYRTLAVDEAFLYINYFGVMDRCVTTLATHFPRLIVDLTPAFFSTPPSHTDGFNSARKFFGVPDGAFLFAENAIDWGKSLPRQRTCDSCRSLLWRTEESYDTEPGYLEFLRQESAMDRWPLARMSRISERMLRSINLPQIARLRRQHFRWFHERLRERNTLRLDSLWANGTSSLYGVKPTMNAAGPHGTETLGLDGNTLDGNVESLDGNTLDGNALDGNVETPVPLYYPLLPSKKGLGAVWKRELCRNRVFVPTLWPDLESTLRLYCDEDAMESRLVRDLVCLPITQHCNDDDLARILRLLDSFAH